MKAVVDASVLLASTLPSERFRDDARRWLGSGVELVAPRLLWFEVSSVLRRLEYRGVLDSADAERILEGQGASTGTPVS